MLLDLENMGIAVGISFLSCIQAELFHIHSRLQAAIFYFLLTLTSNSNNIRFAILFDPSKFHLQFQVYE